MQNRLCNPQPTDISDYDFYRVKLKVEVTSYTTYVQP